MNWFFEKIRVRKLTGGTIRSNTPMIRIMEKTGMVLEAVRYKQELLANEPQDLLYYAKYLKDVNLIIQNKSNNA